ncbi:hypothetical protein FNV43_RR09637 [Rhamnella rubrinervis]|uniref:Lipoxygenase n=1 Tax=Rhamnella rubrinervis TaxID=2594499 RepID=A0A8K0HBL6_9ROSA|nr:hypothetical protein FNV43_RR09637 [Rhamnella rubrinervis]
MLNTLQGGQQTMSHFHHQAALLLLQNHSSMVRVGSNKQPSSTIKAVVSVPTEIQKSTSVKAVVTVQVSDGRFLSSIGIKQLLHVITGHKSLLLELVSSELDPKTGTEKSTIKAHAHKCWRENNEIKYESNFNIPADFGTVGGVLVENHFTEMFLKDIVLEFPDGHAVNFTCNSWLHSKFDNPHKRVFFTNKSYLPSETPSGLRRLREEELQILRGNGQGERKSFDRIYDYDVYNDIGDPDKDDDLKRPVLGGKEHPYPRRCRTGRPRCTTDPLSESRNGDFYVPRDEAFSEVKRETYITKAAYLGLRIHLTQVQTGSDRDLGFPHFTAIDCLFNEGNNCPPLIPLEKKGRPQNILPKIIKAIEDSDDFLRFETPKTMDRDKFFWFRDAEFGRQTLAGLNPCSIELITEWPLKSQLDPKIYGPPYSAITTEVIEQEIKGFMTIDEAIKEKKLFLLDYHDLLLPYVSKVRELKGTTLYGSRTVFFLKPDGTLKPLAIELTRPPIGEKPQWKQVYTPSCDATDIWLWRIAKAHVLAHDAGYHQLVSHWLRTHCATEPYIIATNRQLSAMHPIYRLLHPHFRYTMEINALARQALINAGGIIETSFSPGKYSTEFSSVAYDKQWRFDLQALPADLISRGMAVEDPSWVTDYVNHYYPDGKKIESDQELQEWWTEIRTKGHEDKKDEPWWPVLKTPKDLIDIITTMVWVTSGYHAALNFGQYTYAGYFPNRPTIARINMPTEEPSEEFWNNFIKKPEGALLQCFPSQIQATTVMAVLDLLSNHSPDEEYLGEQIEAPWAEDAIIKAAFERFSGRLKELEGIVDERNANHELRNRSGAGVVPYELLKPFSDPGVTGKGVPYSITI